MRKLEQYKDFLLPVEDIIYACYMNQSKDTDGGTFVWIRKEDDSVLSIQISKKNVLSDFYKWYKKFQPSAITGVSIGWDGWDKNITPSWGPGWCPYAGTPVNKCIETGKEDKPFDASPKVVCQKTGTTGDFVNTVTTVF